MTPLKWKISGIVLMIGIAFFYLNYTIQLNILSEKERLELAPARKEMLMKKSISLGLDLQGGMHLVLEVNKDKVEKNTLLSEIKYLKEELDDEHIDGKITFNKEEKVYIFELSQRGFSETSKKILKKSKYFITEEVSPTLFKLKPDAVLLDKAADEATNRALEILRNRIDEFGVSEPVIRRQGITRIIVELAGVKDPNRAKRLIGKRAVLEFKMVEEDEELNAQAAAGNVPTGYEYMENVSVSRSGKKNIEHILVRSTAEMTGEYLKDAHVQYDPMTNRPEVGFVFSGKGKDMFAGITEKNIGKRLAIILDNKIQSAPRIQSRIYGSGRIEGSFTPDEAKDLAIVLRAGTLPAPIEIIEDRTVGPSLGRDSIQSGKRACIWGMVVVILFMLARYKISGFLSDISLMINILFVLSALAAFHATLTLPGIAGIVLTIGMAVDANVIIYERIKEEIASGKTTHSSVDLGFKRAFTPILDANLTTIIAAFFLYQFGTGPIKGFAVTLGIGIISSIVTAFLITKTFFEIWLIKPVEKLSI